MKEKVSSPELHKSSGKIKLIGIGEVGFGRSPEILATVALGSCVAVVIYDPKKKIAGMAHVMLPKRDRPEVLIDKVGRYADIAVHYLINTAISMGSLLKDLRAKIAGGASMFKFIDGVNPIGVRNVESVKNELRKWNILITGEDVLGNVGRSVEFHTFTCKMVVKTKFGRRVI